MIDRLEELLEQMTREDGREREDDAMELAGLPACPVPRDAQMDETARAGAEETPRPGGPEEAVRPAGAADEGEAAPAARLGGRSEAPKTPEHRGAEAEAPPPAAESEQRGLAELYRQTVRAGRREERALPAEQTGRTLQAREPAGAAGLTVEELDRAVRRDSRRYDGGMTIF